VIGTLARYAENGKRHHWQKPGKKAAVVCAWVPGRGCGRVSAVRERPADQRHAQRAGGNLLGGRQGAGQGRLRVCSAACGVRVRARQRTGISRPGPKSGGAEFAAVLRSLGAVVEGERPIKNGERQRIRAEKDKAGERTIFYLGHLDGVANGYAENNRTKEVRRWKARGEGLSEERKSELLAEAEKNRYEPRRLEAERFEATVARLSAELISLRLSDAQKTRYHEAKGIEPLPDAPLRDGDLLVLAATVEHAPVIHAVYWLGGVVNIDKHYRTGEGQTRRCCEKFIC
jgi:hypothetical protein